MSEAAPRTKRQLRNYLIDRTVQLRITIIMVLLAFLLTAALGVCWYAEIRKASEVVRINAITTLGSEAADSLETELAVQDRQRLFVLIGFAVLLALLIAAYGIVMTHKLAGPLFKIRRHINDIERGRLYPLWGLRKGDQLKDFFADFERMHAALRQRVEQDMMLLNEVIAAIERGDDLREPVERMRQLVGDKGQSLRDASNVTKRLIRPPA